MLRYLAKEKRSDRSENFKKQESMISKQARLPPDAVNTSIPASTIATQTCVPHLPELKIANKINGRFLGNE
jgi:hypothetical protein